MKKIDSLLLQAEPKKAHSYDFIYISVECASGGGFNAIQSKAKITEAFKLMRGELKNAEILELYFETAAELEAYLNKIPKPHCICADAEIYNSGHWIETKTSPKANENGQPRR